MAPQAAPGAEPDSTHSRQSGSTSPLRSELSDHHARLLLQARTPTIRLRALDRADRRRGRAYHRGAAPRLLRQLRVRQRDRHGAAARLPRPGARHPRGARRPSEDDSRVLRPGAPARGPELRGTRAAPLLERVVPGDGAVRAAAGAAAAADSAAPQGRVEARRVRRLQRSRQELCVPRHLHRAVLRRRVRRAHEGRRARRPAQRRLRPGLRLRARHRRRLPAVRLERAAGAAAPKD